MVKWRGTKTKNLYTLHRMPDIISFWYVYSVFYISLYTEDTTFVFMLPVYIIHGCNLTIKTNPFILNSFYFFKTSLSPASLSSCSHSVSFFHCRSPYLLSCSNTSLAQIHCFRKRCICYGISPKIISLTPCKVSSLIPNCHCYLHLLSNSESSIFNTWPLTKSINMLMVYIAV